MRIEVKFNAPNFAPITLNPPAHAIATTFEHYQVITTAPDVEMYAGSYSVTPTVNGQTIPTARKYMLEDLEIKAIPRFNTSNVSGGTTVYIANEVE